MLKYVYIFYAFLETYRNKKVILVRGDPVSPSLRIFHLQNLVVNLGNLIVESTPVMKLILIFTGLWAR